MIKKTSGMLSVLLFLFLGSTANPAFSAPLYECPFKGSGGDRIDHAFYLENYSSSTLGRVTLGFYTLVPGRLAARVGGDDLRSFLIPFSLWIP